MLQKQEPLPVGKADLHRLPYHSIYLVKRDPPPAVKPTPVPIEKPDLLPVDNFYLEKDVPDVHKLRENRAARIIAHSDVNLVQQHFNRMRNRPQTAFKQRHE